MRYKELSDVRVKKCLLVEDDEVTAFLSMRVLNEHKAFDELLHVDSGEEALAITTETCFDLIILDFSLPGIDGGEFIERYIASCNEKRMRSARIIIVSSSDDFEEYQGLLEREEVIGVLQKPLRPDQLLELCADYLV